MSEALVNIDNADANSRPGTEDVPAGYKLTEVGVIPEDWEVRNLGAMGEFKNGINKDKKEFGHGFPFVNLMDVFGIPKISTNSSFGLVNSTSGEREAYALQSGDVLFVRSSVKPEGVGLTTVILEDLPNTVFSGFLIRYRDYGALDLKFKEHCFHGSCFRNHLTNSSTVSANTNISQDSLKSLKFAFPPNKYEQRAIAGALSDVDKLLESLDALIAKKRAIKQAAMQQLLTGKTRLPGFTKEWVTRPLSEVGSIRSGGTPSTENPKYWDGNIPWCTPTDITNLRDRKCLTRTLQTISDEGLHSSSAEVIPPQSLIMTSRATIGECAINLVPVTTSQGFKNIIAMDGIDIEFLYYLMAMQTSNLIALCGGSTFLEIGKKQLESFMITLPKNLDEQQAIATVLSDMDAEITALEQRRDKTRVIKQGMMQQLLTGRVRLV